MTIQDEFISTVSHELRTPLTSIRGFSQTLLNSWDRIDDNNKKKFIKIIEEQSTRLINLVENILTVSKANNGNLVLKKVDVNSLIEKMITIFKEQYKKHKFVFNKNSNILLSRLDEDKFQQIITNLLDNAGKYSKDGSTITITTGFCNNMIFIDIKDEGVGIKKDDFDKLFKKFSRSDGFASCCRNTMGKIS